ncbi:uncharacterized RING finger protein C32D5.10-like [Salvia hispanica]|uniref:uncharacterized RING finger protein C32D5.10-like n=1 Tax=Salvia hispanica TaxID=49212 RepID=UPI0020098ABC|nr:uncharacterized RING finger protein C32D5.10-like [Salvia hispanica]
MDETDTEIDDLEFEESSTTRWWPSTMGEVRVDLPAVDPFAQYSNYFVPVVLNPTPLAPSRDPPQGDVLSGFKTRRIDDKDQHEEEVCSICLDNLYSGSATVTVLDCQHEFHPDCIRRWLVDGQNFCPLCKAPAIK